MSDLVFLIGGVTTLIVAFTNLLVALVGLLVSLRNARKTVGIEKGLNGRLDQLMQEQERRVRAEYAEAITQPPSSVEKARAVQSKPGSPLD